MLRPKPMLLVAGIAALLFGAALTFAPDFMQESFGLVPDAAGRVLARDLGVVLLAVGAMDLLAMNAEPGRALDAILWANLLVQGLETLLDVYHVATGQIGLASIGAIVFHILLGVGFALTLRKPRAAGTV